jgi:O-antigen/teichoic acid export membrane protein
MSEITSVLKRNAGWHAFTMLLTGTSAFLGIVFTKQTLVPDQFIQFNLKINAILMINVFTISWLTISMFRMLHAKKEFYKIDNLCFLALASAFLAGIPAFALWFFLLKPAGQHLLPFIFLLLISVYGVLLVSQQAALNARSAWAGEAIRSATLLALLCIPVIAGEHVSESYCWWTWIISYSSGIFYFVIKAKGGFFLSLKGKPAILQGTYKEHLVQTLRFGLPFCIWILISYLMTNADRWYLARQAIDVGEKSDYLAMADTMMRGVGFIFMPLNTSAFPLISQLHDKGDRHGVKAIMLKILGLQTLLVIGAIIGFYLLRSQFFWLLNIEHLTSPLLVGMILLIIHAVFQVSFILQKPVEMVAKTSLLAFLLSLCALVVYLLLWIIVRPATVTGITCCLGAGMLLYIPAVLAIKGLVVKRH